MCGVVGVYSHQHVSQDVFDGITLLQHRGQDAAGIITCDNGIFNIRRGSGLVSQVFEQKHMDRLKGNIGIGHVRYPTAGGVDSSHNQPFTVNSPYGIALGHNGNLVNVDELRKLVVEEDRRHLNTQSDSEVLLNVMAHELHLLDVPALKPDDIFEAMTAVHKRCVGGYACVAIIANHGLIGFRDPNGIRPLILGKRESIVDGNIKTEYMIASESVALSCSGFEIINDVAPGEVVYIDIEGTLHRKGCAEKTRLMPCIFEHVYLSRPDSLMDGVSIYKTRLRQGKALAKRILKVWGQEIVDDIDVVVPVPDTSRVASQTLAEDLGKNMREGLMKNRYIGRTFIMSNQCEREKSVRRKHNPVELEIRDKSILLVDDSIVRGTTGKGIVDMMRQTGARKIYLASAAPKVLHPNVYGIDMAAKTDFVATDRTDEQIAEFFGVEKVIFQDQNDLIQCSKEGNPDIESFECSVFDGEYCVGNINDGYLAKLASARSNEAKQKIMETDVEV